MAGENGTNIRLKLDGNVVAGKLNSTFTSNRDEIELSDADDGAESFYVMGRKHREMSGEYNLNTTAAANDLNDLWDAHDGATLTPFIYGGTDSGDFVLEGNCYIRDIELADPDNERSTVTVTMRVVGAVTKSTYT